jgi:hypothetical protein
MKEIAKPIHELIYYKLNLQTAGIIVGVLLLLTHVWALLKGETAKDFLRKLPRSQSVGSVLLTIAALWAWMLTFTVDLGEFSGVKTLATFGIPVAYVGLLLYANDYLGARSLGILALLVASPLLDAAFQQPVQSRLFLVALVYVWVLLGLFWVGMPYTLRDQVNWVLKSEGLFKAAVYAGIVYGILLLVCAFAFWGGLGRLVHSQF